MLLNKAQLHIDESKYSVYPLAVSGPHSVYFTTEGLVYEVYGTGEGDYPWLNNNVFGRILFEDSVDNVIILFGI